MKIRIISIPAGTPPLWIRKAMVGLVFPVIEEADYQKYRGLSKYEPIELNGSKKNSYFVAAEEIAKAVTEPLVVEWLKNNPDDTFFFFKIYCRQVL